MWKGAGSQQSTWGPIFSAIQGGGGILLKPHCARSSEHKCWQAVPDPDLGATSELLFMDLVVCFVNSCSRILLVVLVSCPLKAQAG